MQETADFRITKAALAGPPNISSISYWIFVCLFSVFITFYIISYETSHLAKIKIRMYYEDTKKE